MQCTCSKKNVHYNGNEALHNNYSFLLSFQNLYQKNNNNITTQTDLPDGELC